MVDGSIRQNNTVNSVNSETAIKT